MNDITVSCFISANLEMKSTYILYDAYEFPIYMFVAEGIYFEFEVNISIQNRV